MLFRARKAGKKPLRLDCSPTVALFAEIYPRWNDADAHLPRSQFCYNTDQATGRWTSASATYICLRAYITESGNLLPVSHAELDIQMEYRVQHRALRLQEGSLPAPRTRSAHQQDNERFSTDALHNASGVTGFCPGFRSLRQNWLALPEKWWVSSFAVVLIKQA